MTRARSRRQGKSPQSDPPDPGTVGPSLGTETPRRRRRKDRHDANVQKSLEPWTPTFLSNKQSEDPDLCKLRGCILSDNQPSWDNIWGESPSLKAYHKQWDSLVLKNGVLYRRL